MTNYSPNEVDNFHRHSDVDGSQKALHHTLGPGFNQAAGGSHTHDGTDSQELELYVKRDGAVVQSPGVWDKQGTSTLLDSIFAWGNTIADTYMEVTFDRPCRVLITFNAWIVVPVNANNYGRVRLDWASVDSGFVGNAYNERGWAGILNLGPGTSIASTQATLSSTVTIDVPAETIGFWMTGYKTGAGSGNPSCNYSSYQIVMLQNEGLL